MAQAPIDMPQPPGGERAAADTPAATVVEAQGPCPEGWGCGSDGICRRWSGRLEAFSAIEADVLQIAVADFDGDLGADVVAIGSSGIGVHYLDEDGDAEDTTFVGAPDQVPAIGDLTGDGRADLVVTLGVGVGIALGREDRSLESVVFPSFEARTPPGQIVGVGTLPLDDGPVSGDDALLVTRDDVRLFQGDGWMQKWEPASGYKISFDETIPVGDLVEEAARPSCEEVVLGIGAETGLATEPVLATELVLYRACDEISTPIVVLSDEHVAGPVQILDLDQDNHKDVIFTTRKKGAGGGQPSETYNLAVMYGDGAGSFSSRHATQALCRQASITRGPVSTLCAEPLQPLSLGDLDGDGGVDAIHACAIHVSGGASLQTTCPDEAVNSLPDVFNVEAPWSTARIGDLNGDALPDVLAGSRINPGLFFFRGTGTQALNPSVIPTLRNVQEMALGDFDGDSIADVALREDEGVGPQAFLSIAFGRHLSTPEAPVPFGSVPFAVQLFTSDLGVASSTLDAMTDLGVILRAPTAESAKVAIFPGNAARLMQSTVFLGMPGPGAVTVPRRAAIGHLGVEGASGVTPDVGVLAIQANALSVSAGLWHVPLWDPALGVGGPEGSTLGLVTPAEGFGGLLPATFGFTARVAAVHLGEGPDKLVVVGLDSQTEQGPQGARMVVAAPCGPDEPCVPLLQVSLEDDDDKEITAVGDLVIADVNGDEPPRDDVSVLLNAPGSSYVLVLWNGGTGGLDPASSSRIEIPEVESDRMITAFAWLDVDSEPRKAAVVLTKSAVYLARLQDDNSFVVARWEVWSGGMVPGGTAPGGTASGGTASGDVALSPGRGGRGVAVGDVDGDGLADVVIADVGLFEVLRAVPVNR